MPSLSTPDRLDDTSGIWAKNGLDDALGNLLRGPARRVETHSGADRPGVAAFEGRLNLHDGRSAVVVDRSPTTNQASAYLWIVRRRQGGAI